MLITIYFLSVVALGSLTGIGFLVFEVRKLRRALYGRIDPSFDPGPLSPVALRSALRNPRLFTASKALDRVQSAVERFVPKGQ